MADEIIIETTSAEVIEVGVPGPQGPAGAAGTGLETLTTQGDTLYRGASTGERLPIGSAGQVLKVVNGLPAWANESGSVTSVNGQTGAVTVAAINHTHEVADVFFQGLEILGAGNANTNGIYVYGGDLNGKGIYYKDKDTFVYWDGAAWTISYNTNDIYSSAQNTTTPWQVTSWSVESGQTSPAPSSWDRLTGDQWEAVVGQRINPTLRGDAAGKNVGTGANDVAAGNHTHTAATTSVAGFLSAADKTKLDGIASGATAATASNATPSALGTAAAGTSSNFARADHVHAMPSAASTGAVTIQARETISMNSSPATTRGGSWDNNVLLLPASRNSLYFFPFSWNAPATRHIRLPTNNNQTGDIIAFQTNFLPAQSGLEFYTFSPGPGWSLQDSWVNATASGVYYQYFAQFVCVDGASGSWELQGRQWQIVAPPTSTSQGTSGQLAYKDPYLYVCVNQNLWRRVPVAAW